MAGGGGAAIASHDGGDSYGESTTLRAVSYMNPDTGAATEDADVDRDSNCFSPDRYDSQRLSDSGTANRNVHNDAYLFEGDGDRYGDAGSDRKVDAPASYDSSGVGFISACPDPDNAGPKYAIAKGRNGDGRIDVLALERLPGEGCRRRLRVPRLAEQHHDDRPAVRRLVLRPDGDGCGDEKAKDRIVIDWPR